MHATQANEVARLHRLVEGLSQNQELGIAQIGQIAEIFALPDAILQDINRRRVLKGLEFDQIEARHEQISQAARDTFGWCISDEAVPKGQGDLRVSLQQWLRSGNGIFHISAKPGGGKSTLMKMLESHKSTSSLLKTWTTERKLVKASFFVWKAGVPLQKNLQGMVRTLLRQVLQQVPELIQVLFPKYWKPREFSPWMPFDGFKIKLDDVNDAVQRLMTDAAIAEPYRFCFFIDGLDEFEDQELKHTELAEYLREWVAYNPTGVKFCVSSREEPAFMNTFAAEQRLRLHLLTRPDIKAMVEERLMKHPRFRAYKSAEQQQFVLAVVTRAEGVFLWVHLLVKNELWPALDEGATVDDLLKLLRGIPEELDEFFALIVNSIRKSNKQEAAMIFAVAIQTDGWRYPLRVFHYSFLEDFVKNPNFSITLQWRWPSGSIDLSSQNYEERFDRFKRRLPGLCKGLLDHAPDGALGIRSGAFEHDNGLLFAHRSVYDFLKSGPADSIKAAMEDNNAKASFLIQCLTAEAKHLDWGQYSLDRRSSVLGSVMGILSSFPSATKPWLTLLTHLEEALAQRQSRLSLANQRSMLGPNFRRLASPGGSQGYLSIYTLACLWQLRTYVEWARETYPSWILEDSVGSEIFDAAMRSRVWRRHESIIFMLNVFLDPNGPSPIATRRGNGSPWMIFIKEALVNGRIVRDNFGFWLTFIAFLEHGADPLLHVRCRWREKKYIGQDRDRDLGVLEVSTDVETDLRRVTFTFGNLHESIVSFFGAQRGGRADLVDFVRYFNPPDMDKTIDLIQSCREKVHRTKPGSFKIVDTKAEAASAQEDKSWWTWLSRTTWNWPRPT